MTIATLKRDIAPGEKFTHTGSLLLEGKIGAGAEVVIKEGGLQVKGAVEDKATLDVEGANSSVTSVSISGAFGGSISIGNISGGRVIINGVEIKGNGGDENIAGLIVEGRTGDGVRMKSGSSIELKDDAGAGLTAGAGLSFEAKGVGEKATITAENSAGVTTLGEGSVVKSRLSAKIGSAGKCEIYSGNSVTVGTLGAGSKVESRLSADIEKIGDDCTVDSSLSAKAGSVGRNSKVTARLSLEAKLVHRTATLKSRFSPKVGRYTDNDAETAVAAPKAAAAGKKGWSLFRR